MVTATGIVMGMVPTDMATVMGMATVMVNLTAMVITERRKSAGTAWAVCFGIYL